MSRRIATESDLQIGTRVYRGFDGTTEYQVFEIREPRGTGSDGRPNTKRTYLLQRVGMKRGAGVAYWAEELTIDDGMDVLRELLKLDDF